MGVRSGGAKRRAFTLVELIVVVGILAVLAALLMPAFNKVRRQARTVACLSNLRRLHQTFDQYVIQNDDRAPAYDPSYHTYWLQALRASNPEIKNILLCPEADETSFAWGNAGSNWGPYKPGRGSPGWMSFLRDDTSSYGFNGWLYDSDDVSQPFYKYGVSGDLDRTPVFADANWVDGYPTSADPVPADLTRGALFGEPSLGRFCLARHGMSANSVFADGHAEQVPLENLWLLRWSTAFTPRVVSLHGPPIGGRK